MGKGVILIGHGSKMPGFQKPMEALARELRKDKALTAVQCAYLEITQPSIPDAISAFVKKGVKKIAVVPYFLLSGMHVKVDIPGIVKEAALTHRGKARIFLSPYLGFDDTIVKLVKKRIKQAKIC